MEVRMLRSSSTRAMVCGTVATPLRSEKVKKANRLQERLAPNMADLWPEVGRNLGRLRRFWDIERATDQDNARRSPQPRFSKRDRGGKADGPLLQRRPVPRERPPAVGMAGHGRIVFCPIPTSAGECRWNGSRGRRMRERPMMRSRTET